MLICAISVSVTMLVLCVYHRAPSHAEAACTDVPRWVSPACFLSVTLRSRELVGWSVCSLDCDFSESASANFVKCGTFIMFSLSAILTTEKWRSGCNGAGSTTRGDVILPHFRPGNGSPSASNVLLLLLDVIESTKAFSFRNRSSSNFTHTHWWQYYPQSHRVGFSS